MTSDLTREQNSAKPYADRSFSDRFIQMGTQAEQAAEKWFGGRIFQRVGWDRSPLPKEAFWFMPAEVRHLPDYFLWDDGLFWVECIGTASGLGFKIRKTKLESQKHYHDSVPLIYFAYRSTDDSYATLSWDEVRERAVTPKFFKDGNAYYEIGVDAWTPLT